MNEIKLREELIKICNKNGIKYNYLARQIQVSPSLFSKWKKGERKLSLDKLIKLQNFINGLNYKA